MNLILLKNVCAQIKYHFSETGAQYEQIIVIIDSNTNKAYAPQIYPRELCKRLKKRFEKKWVVFELARYFK